MCLFNGYLGFIAGMKSLGRAEVKNERSFTCTYPIRLYLIMFEEKYKSGSPLLMQLIVTSLLRSRNLSELLTVKYGRTPLIRKLVIRNSNNPDQLGSSGKFVENSTKLTCLEITCFRIKYSTVLWLLELQVRRGRNVETQLLVQMKSFPVTGPVVTQRVGRGIALLFHDHGTRRW